MRGAFLADHRRNTKSQLCIYRKERPSRQGTASAKGQEADLSWECLPLKLHKRKHKIRSEKKEGPDPEDPTG